jgi:hypothetical protein
MGPQALPKGRNRAPWRGLSRLQSRESSRLFFPPRGVIFNRAVRTRRMRRHTVGDLV